MQQGLIKNMLVYGLGGALGRLISFLLLPLFTRHLSPADFGLAAVLQIVSLIVLPLIGMGMGAALAPRFYAAEPGADRRSTVASAAAVAVVGSFLLLGTTAGSGAWLADLLFDEGGSARLLLLGLASTAAAAITQPFQLGLQFEGQARASVVVSIAGTLSTGLLSIAAVVFFRWGVEGWQAAVLISQMLQLALAAVYYVRLDAAWPQPSWANALSLAKSGISLVPAFVVVWAMQQSGRWFLQEHHGLHQLGLFSVGASLGAVASLLTQAFQNAWVPFFMQFKDDPERGANSISQTATLYAAGCAVVVVAFSGFARPVLSLLTTEEFAASAPVVALAAGGQCLLAGASLLMPPQYFAGTLSHITCVQFTAAAAAVPASWFLATRFGLAGASASLCLSPALLLAFHATWNVKFARRYPLSLRFDKPRLVAALAVTVLLGSAPACLPGHGFWTESAVGVLLASVAAVSMWWLIPPGTRQRARSGLVTRLAPSLPRRAAAWRTRHHS